MLRKTSFVPVLLGALVMPSTAPAQEEQNQVRAPLAQNQVSAQLAGPQATSDPVSITLRVPVKLQQMSEEAKSVLVRCIVYSGSHGRKEEKVIQIPTGDLDQVVEMEFTVGPPVFYDSYKCWLRVSRFPSGIQFETPLQGNPKEVGGQKLWRLARPDRFFQVELEGPLGGVQPAALGAQAAEPMQIQTENQRR